MSKSMNVQISERSNNHAYEFPNGKTFEYFKLTNDYDSYCLDIFCQFIWWSQSVLLTLHL